MSLLSIAKRPINNSNHLFFSFVCAVALLCGASSNVAAQEAHKGPRLEFGRNADRYEIRLGLLAYDQGAFSEHHQDGLVYNGELVFPSPAALKAIGSPRPYVGTNITSVTGGINVAYAGLTWDAYVTNKIYLLGSLGGSVNDAKNVNPKSGKALGSNVLFHLAVGVGFDITPNTTLQLYADHFSNANLATRNQGLENAGIRIGQRF